ncbi:uncharacterized protein LOC135147000 isoform X3 [Daucus carota subsp. sativus]
MELDALKFKGDSRYTRSYNMSRWSQAFYEPRWKLEMVMQCIRKYVAKRYMNPVLRKLHHMRTRTRFNKLSGGEVLFYREPSSQQATTVVAVVLRATVPWCCRRACIASLMSMNSSFIKICIGITINLHKEVNCLADLNPSINHQFGS